MEAACRIERGAVQPRGAAGGGDRRVDHVAVGADGDLDEGAAFLAHLLRHGRVDERRVVALDVVDADVDRARLDRGRRRRGCRLYRRGGWRGWRGRHHGRGIGGRQGRCRRRGRFGLRRGFDDVHLLGRRGLGGLRLGRFRLAHRLRRRVRDDVHLQFGRRLLAQRRRDQAELDQRQHTHVHQQHHDEDLESTRVNHQRREIESRIGSERLAGIRVRGTRVQRLPKTISETPMLMTRLRSSSMAQGVVAARPRCPQEKTL
ncbi:protein of unknown function [Ralstonia solanacearum PSI07]|nr:protein of unknown function [Ralstonia solanacearum PSI07]